MALHRDIRFDIACMAQSYFVEIFARNWQVYTLAKVFSYMAVGLGQSGLTTYIAEIS